MKVRIYTVLDERKFEEEERYQSVHVFPTEALAVSYMLQESDDCYQAEHKLDDKTYLHVGPSKYTVSAGTHQYNWTLDFHDVEPTELPRQTCQECISYSPYGEHCGSHQSSVKPNADCSSFFPRDKEMQKLLRQGMKIAPARRKKCIDCKKFFPLGDYCGRHEASFRPCDDCSYLEEKED